MTRAPDAARGQGASWKTRPGRAIPGYINLSREKRRKGGYTVTKKLPKILPRHDVAKILAVPNVETVTGLRNRVILQVMYHCGLRVSEVTNLTVNDVDMEKGFLYVQLGKGGHDRYVPLDHDTLTWIKKYSEVRPKGSDWLFCTKKGDQLDVRYVREIVYRYAKKAEVYLQNGKTKKLPSPHTLRHCCFTELIDEGVFNIREVQELAGHASLNTTMIYTHVNPETLAQKMRQRGNPAANNSAAP